MKKLLSLTLAVVIALSILIVPMGASATTKGKTKTTVNTYIPKTDEYFTDDGRVYSQGRKLYFTNNDGETYLLTK
ncbi:MAG: hypothetical protein ACI4HZ_10980, partial [Ruminococcus sp.]